MPQSLYTLATLLQRYHKPERRSHTRKSCRNLCDVICELPQGTNVEKTTLDLDRNDLKAVEAGDDSLKLDSDSLVTAQISREHLGGGDDPEATEAKIKTNERQIAMILGSRSQELRLQFRQRRLKIPQ